MRATLIYGPGDVRVENVPDAHLFESSDALVRVTRAAICGSDLWPYKSMRRPSTAVGWATSSSVERDVELIETEDLDDRLDAADRAKYGGYASPTARITSNEARAATLRLGPR